MPTAAEYESNKRKTEAELRARLGAQPDATSSDTSTGTKPAYVPRNPYIVTLVVLACLCALVAFVLYIVSISAVDGSGSPDAAGRAAAAGFATDWVAFALLFFIPFLILGGAKWKAPATDRD